MSDQSTPVTRLPLRKGASLRWLPFLFIFLQSVLYGLGDPISKSAYEVLPVYSLLTARYGIALAFLLLVFGRRIWRGLKVCSPRDWLLEHGSVADCTRLSPDSPFWLCQQVWNPGEGATATLARAYDAQGNLLCEWCSYDG